MRMMHIILDMELWRLTGAAGPFLENGGTFGANVRLWRAIIKSKPRLRFLF